MRMDCHPSHDIVYMLMTLVVSNQQPSFGAVTSISKIHRLRNQEMEVAMVLIITPFENLCFLFPQFLVL
jgi:hypothetical protein